jgi:hypothetical protein
MSKSGQTYTLSTEITVLVRPDLDGAFTLTFEHRDWTTSVRGIEEHELEGLSKKFAEAVDFYRDADPLPVSEPSPRAARDRVPFAPGRVVVRMRYYDYLDRMVMLPYSTVPGWRVDPDGRNRMALLHAGFTDWLRCDQGDGGPTEAGLHQEAQMILHHIATSEEDAGMFGYGEKYIAWRAE